METGKTLVDPVRLALRPISDHSLETSNLSARPQNLDLFDDLSDALAPAVAAQVEALARLEGLEGAGRCSPVRRWWGLSWI